MNDIEAIGLRKSRRTYLDRPIEHEKLAIIKKQIEDENNKYGLSIQFVEDGSSAFQGIRKSYGLFKGVKSLIILKGAKNDVHLREKVGYAGERIVLEAVKLSLGTCWVGGTFEQKNPIFNCAESEEMICVIPIGYVPEEQRFTEKLIYKAVHRKSKSINQLYTSDITVPEWFTKGIEAVQKAPSAVNSQKVMIHFKESAILAAVPNDYPMDLVDLGIAKLHFELAADGKFNLGNGSYFIKN